MRHTNLALALLTAAVLTACGGNGSKSGDQTLATKYSAQITFGDSLSDVGTYAVGPIAAAGGGKWTINGDNTKADAALTGKNWTELVAAQLSLAKPCAAQTGGYGVAVQNHTECLNYAQGGARVTMAAGPGNTGVDASGVPLGQMTVPVAQQITNHLQLHGGKFAATELVTVMAGGNDILTQLGQLQAQATATGTAAGQTTFATSLTTQLAAGAPDPASAAVAIGTAIQTESANPTHTDQSVVTAAVTAAVGQGNTAVADPAVYGPMVVKAQADATAAGTKAGNDFMTANAGIVVAAMATAGADLVNLVKTQIIGNGATRVIVNNLPDVASTPSAANQSADVKALITAAATAFNDQLKNGLANEPKVLVVDLYSVSHDQANNKDSLAVYGLTDTKKKACTGSSLTCSSATLTDTPAQVSRYMFADDIHPTPYEYSLVARYVLEQMAIKGWL